MLDLDSIIDTVIDNVIRIFSFEEWIELDLRFSKSEILTMLYLDRRKELTMTELVEYINSPMSTATGIADRLVRSGCIRRERSEADRRVVILTLTEKGAQLVKGLKDTLQNYIDMAVGNLTEEETRLLTGIVFKILDNLQRKPDKGGIANRNEEAVRQIEIE